MVRGSTILFVLSFLFINNHFLFTSYENIMTEMIDEFEVVKKITIENTRNNSEITLLEKELMEDILVKPREMVLKSQEKLPSLHYMIIIHTSEGNYDIGLGETEIHFGYVGTFSIATNNLLFEMLHHMENQ